MSDQSGIRQTPFADAVVPAPSATSGDQGTGGDLDIGGGSDGIIQSPFAEKIVPNPSGTVESGPFGNPSRFSAIDGSTHKGDSELGPIGDITQSRNTIDRR